MERVNLAGGLRRKNNPNHRYFIIHLQLGIIIQFLITTPTTHTVAVRFVFNEDNRLWCGGYKWTTTGSSSNLDFKGIIQCQIQIKTSLKTTTYQGVCPVKNLRNHFPTKNRGRPFVIVSGKIKASPLEQSLYMKTPELESFFIFHDEASTKRTEEFWSLLKSLRVDLHRSKEPTTSKP